MSGSARASDVYWERSHSTSSYLNETFGKHIKLGLTDNITISELIAQGIARAFLDTITFSESIKRDVGLNISDTINLSDLLIAMTGVVLSDSITFSESLKQDVARAILDNINFSENIGISATGGVELPFRFKLSNEAYYKIKNSIENYYKIKKVKW